MTKVPTAHPNIDANNVHTTSSFVFSSKSHACVNNVHMKSHENDMKRYTHRPLEYLAKIMAKMIEKMSHNMKRFFFDLKNAL